MGFVTAIVPPQRARIERKILRRVKAVRCAKWCVAFTVLAAAAFVAGSQLHPSLSIWLLLTGFSSCGLALAAAFAAVVYRITETPRQVTVRLPSGWPPQPRVIHLRGKD